MERESFEDEEVADILNRSFISIKVDREERPDIDSIYMNICQAITGDGGWPLTTIMTYDKKPFFSGTYFPKNSIYGRAGLIQILTSVEQSWKDEDRKEDIINSSESIINQIEKFFSEDESNFESLNEDIIKKTYEELDRYYESIYGGFGEAPKFPTPHNLLFLLRYWEISGDKRALQIVENTLESMYKGGIFDHIGFGFSRYSTDKMWLVPHFEKMLYDNALLILVYTEAYQATGKEFYKYVAERIIEYILRDMVSENGGFYSAEDADSEGVEGKFYLWTPDEIEKILGKEDGERFCNMYDITEKGNFEGENIPNLILGNTSKVDNSIEDMRKKLFAYREKRIHPYKDDKILTSWNGLMIAALAYAGRVFENTVYKDAAKQSAEFILNNLVREDGRLLARYRDGEVAYEAYLEDYAFFVWGLIEIYEANFEVKYLKEALNFSKEMKNLFWDDENGGFFIYGKDSEMLILRPKEIYDGAMPSGNSVAAMNILRLWSITGNMYLKEILDKMFMVFGKKIKDNPRAYVYFISVFMQYEFGLKEIVITPGKDHNTQTVIDEINKKYMPFATVVLNDKSEELLEIIPSLKEKNNIDNKTTMYICRNFTCSEPITEVESFSKKLLT